MKKNTTPNRLIREKSPYLLQHAYNPVDWYPWGEEAFEAARKEDKPIFLSIGYSTCYWCHVMEREVFENESIAELMNTHLICIKVDREEQPDIDRIYMTAVQLMTGSGGWPMSVFLTHDLQPFFGGTYFPPDSRYGRPGFPQLIARISELWNNERENILESGKNLIAHMSAAHIPQATSKLNDAIFKSYFSNLQLSYDTMYGGFSHAPKFPRPAALNALLRYFSRTGEQEAVEMTANTLRAMARGGMYDHLGGGFHRYSVDEQWCVPHFEKMLYDQAQLVCSYLEAYQITHDEFFSTVAKETLRYVSREMTHPEGGFYSAEDAESAFSHEEPHEKEEGTFYLWTSSEIQQALGKHSALFCFHYGIEPEGNAPSDPMGVFKGKNILYAKHSVDETAKEFNLTVAEIEAILQQSRTVLFNKRATRPRPHLDDKIITAWNGLMISAYARAYQVLGSLEYLNPAKQAATFVLKHLYDSKKRLLYRRWREGESRFNGSLQDYAFLIQGLLDLYEASFEPRWLEYAITLTKRQIEIFYDSADGGFFDSSSETAMLLIRMKEDYDGAEPTGNSIAALNLLRLAHLTSNDDWKSKAEQTFKSFGGILSKRPDVLPQMLVALDWFLSTPKEFVIAGGKDARDTNQLLQEIHNVFIPNKVVLLADGAENQALIGANLPFITPMNPLEGKATLYCCENFACQLPTSDISVVRELLMQNSVKLK